MVAMDITFLGKTGFKIAARSLTVVIDAKPSVKADVHLQSSQSETEREGLLFDGPGEYEVKGAMIDGVALDGNNIGFSLLIDDVRLAHLGNLSQDNLTDDQLQAIGAVDVLMVPLDGRKAEVTSKLISQLEPRIIIPMDFDDEGLKSFISETGASGDKLDRLKTSHKELFENSQKVVILQPKD